MPVVTSTLSPALTVLFAFTMSPAFLVMLPALVLMSPAFLVMLFWLVVTFVLVSLSWLPLTASVLLALMSPAATPVKMRSPSVPATLMLLPPVCAPTVIAPVPASWRTMPVLPVTRFVMSPALVLMSSAFLLMLFWLVVTLVLVALSWLPLTASVLLALMSPAATPVIFLLPLLRPALVNVTLFSGSAAVMVMPVLLSVVAPVVTLSKSRSRLVLTS